jgi:hypothetical protein
MKVEFSQDLNDVLKELARCIVALGPYQRDAVLSGGLVPVMYRRTLRSDSRLEPLTTFDLDWSVPQQLAMRGDNLHARMLNAGFSAQASGSADLPVTHYVPPNLKPESPIYAEFLAPRIGGKHNRKGDNKGIIEVQPGLFAQTDPYLGLLLAKPITVNVAKVPELELPAENSFLLPNPMCFIIQKALIRKNRRQGKQDNDACHIYDVAMLTYSIWSELRAILQSLIDSKRFPPKWFDEALTVLRSAFESAASAGSLAVTRNYSSVTSGEEAVRVMTAFLDECWK